MTSSFYFFHRVFFPSHDKSFFGKHRDSGGASLTSGGLRPETDTGLFNRDPERTETELIAALIENDWQFSENPGDVANATLAFGDVIFCFRNPSFQT